MKKPPHKPKVIIEYCYCKQCQACYKAISRSQEENKKWREGRLCEICGEAKPPNFTTTCSECLENG